MLSEIENFQKQSVPDGEIRFSLHSRAFLICHISWVRPGAHSKAEACLGIPYHILPSLFPFSPDFGKRRIQFHFFFHPLPPIGDNNLFEAVISSPFKSIEVESESDIRQRQIHLSPECLPWNNPEKCWSGSEEKSNPFYSKVIVPKECSSDIIFRLYPES